jgi:hypothetical protein
LDRGELLDVLEEEGVVGFDGVEDAPCDEYADADYTEDLVAPERVGDDGRTSESLLSTNPKDERWDECDCSD